MRPVVKDDGGGRVYAKYQDALDDLADQIGLYCSYCEMPIQNAPEVEHVQPKSLVPGLEREWENFLLGCKTCNATKSNNPVDLADFAFPDSDNTFRALNYDHEKVALDGAITAGERAMMEKTVKLVKLHRHPDEPDRRDRPTARDKRFKMRGETWLIAEMVRQHYEDDPANDVIKTQITDFLAPAKGFFSIWMTVFAGHPEMLNRLIAAFPGTAANCFDATGRPKKRPGGRV